MKYAEYCQQMEHLKIDFADIDHILNNRPIKKWAYCIHDKDTYEDGTPKKEHLHIMMKFNSDQTPENISKWFNDEPNRVEKNKHQFNAYENMCSYLVHETPCEDGKYHYPDEEVKANFNFHEFMEIVRGNVSKRLERKKYREHPLKDVLLKIADNEIPRLKLDDMVNTMDRIRYSKDIEQAYKIRDERLARMTDRELQVLYFYGMSGTGKTTYAKLIGKQQGYSVFVSGSSNDPLQGYMGQECVVIDDIRGSDWKINDLLKLLDNNTNSLAKSRYSNKLMNDCKMMILTSVQDIEELYNNLNERDKEPIRQLMRRCPVKYHFTPDTVTGYQYNEKMGRYDEISKTPNPLHALNFIRNNSDIVAKMNNLLKALEEGEV